ncbi:MAG TPA: hypothetical protein VF838_07745 [Trebonia sp.]
MVAGMLPEAGPLPRRARRLIPAGFPHRGELIAAFAVLIVLAHLLLAQLTIVLALAFAVTGKVTRWRLCWLLAPAVAGLAWMLAAGPGEALAGFAAGPSSVLGYLTGGAAARHVIRPIAAFAGIGGWLPRQFPVALPLAAAEAGLIGWLDWLHTDEWAVPPPRPGAAAALRAALAARRIRSGAVLTRDGLALGVIPSTGAVAGLSWQEASRGVLVAGADAREVTLTCLQLVHAAARRRKPVIVLDDGHDAAIAHAVAATCLATGSPLLSPGGATPRTPRGAPDGSAIVSGALAGSRDAAERPARRPPSPRRGASQLWGRGAGRGVPSSAPAAPDLDLMQVVSERSAALIPVESPESAARAAASLTALGARLRRIGIDGDGLVWVPSAERLPEPVLAALVAEGTAAGLPVLAGAVSPAAAGQLAALVGALLVHRVTDRDLADCLAARAGTRLLPAGVAAARAGQPLPAPSVQPSVQSGQSGQSVEQQAPLTPCPVIEPRTLLSLRAAEFALAASVPRRRVVARARLVPARLPRHAERRGQP